MSSHWRTRMALFVVGKNSLRTVKVRMRRSLIAACWPAVKTGGTSILRSCAKDFYFLGAKAGDKFGESRSRGLIVDPKV